MIDPKKLLSALQQRVKIIEDDLRARCAGNPDVDAPLRADYEAARAKGRTGLTYNAWRDEELTQIAVAWILAGVFVRFLEDNELIDVPLLAGCTAARHKRAQDEQGLFFRQNPTANERGYFEHIFARVGELPGMKGLLDRQHNPLWRVGLSADAAKSLLEFWRKTDPDTDTILHDFADAEWNTRFLGDLYQDLSEAARKKFALLQTPEFVEEFILDRTLTPAIQTFGYKVVRMIDPTCGSGHFLLGGFHRLFKLWQEANPGENPRVLAQRALDGVYGVDLNPFAVAIARFRLLLAALRSAGIRRLKDSPDFRLNLAAGDSLLHGRRFREFESNTGPQRTFDTGDEIFRDELKHHYDVEDAEDLHLILGQQYHAVVGNPPYITVKDKAVSELYRSRYPSCHRQYSLSVPFMERLFDLAVQGGGSPLKSAGFVGQITANSFMKREFGKKLIEEYIPRWDVTHVVDSSKAHVPGHGTPTVILFGKNQRPVSSRIRTVLGIRGEQATPKDPSKGLVWQAICRHIDEPGIESEWVSTNDSPRMDFHRHPWSIGGGGAADLKQQLEEQVTGRLADKIETICLLCKTRLDDAYVVSDHVLLRANIESPYRVPSVIGESVRDWTFTETIGTLFPYDSEGQPVSQMVAPKVHEFLWPYREDLWRRKELGGDHRELEKTWWEWNRFLYHRYKNPASICYSFVATQNNFTFDRSSKVFHGSAPIIKLPVGASEVEYLRLLGTLNSSTACFWMKQVFHDKGGGGIGGGIATEEWEHFFEFAATQLARFPLPTKQPAQIPTALVKISATLQGRSPAAALAIWNKRESGDLLPWLASARILAIRQRCQIIALQEELDWQIYEAFGVVEPARPASSAEASACQVSLPEGEALDVIPQGGIELGQRAFEIVLARRVAAGEVQTTWFERHGSKPSTEIPNHWPAPYRELVERRIRRIAEDPNIRLIEQPAYKRRWNTEPWDEQLKKATREWMLARLEGYFHDGHRVCELKDGFSSSGHGFHAALQPTLVSTNQLATVVEADAGFLAVAEIFSGGPGFSVAKLVRELVEAESIPFLPFQRYKDSGLRKRADWEHVWDLQRQEDAIEADVRGQNADLKEEQIQVLVRKRQAEVVGSIPVPPKYGSVDFKKAHWWKLRGKLDVPKERWVLYPGAERDNDPSPIIAWAGWGHAQQAQALAAYYIDASQNQGWPAERLRPLLAGLVELLPWLKQWHNEFNPDFSSGLGDYFAGFIDEEARKQGTTIEGLKLLAMGNGATT